MNFNKDVLSRIREAFPDLEGRDLSEVYGLAYDLYNGTPMSIIRENFHIDTIIKVRKIANK